MVAQHRRRLHPVRGEDDSLVLRLRSERRDELAVERTRTANRLHALLRDLIPSGATRNLSAAHGAALLRGVHPVTAGSTGAIRGKTVAWPSTLCGRGGRLLESSGVGR